MVIRNKLQFQRSEENLSLLFFFFEYETSSWFVSAGSFTVSFEKKQTEI